MISALFHIVVRPGREDEFHTLARRLTRLTRKEDAGCVNYVFLQQQDKPKEYVLFEQWRDKASLDQHIRHLERILGPPRPGEFMPSALLDLCSETRFTLYDEVD